MGAKENGGTLQVFALDGLPSKVQSWFLITMHIFYALVQAHWLLWLLLTPYKVAIFFLKNTKNKQAKLGNSFKIRKPYHALGRLLGFPVLLLFLYLSPVIVSMWLQTYATSRVKQGLN